MWYILICHPAIFLGDFNSHHSEWEYADSDDDSEWLIDWAINNNFVLIHDVKQCDTFLSARWSKEYSTNICWVSSLDDHPQPVSCIELDNVPHSQQTITHPRRVPATHCSKYNSSVSGIFIKQIGKSSAMFWNNVVTILSCCIPVDEAYRRFQGAIYIASYSAIPQGYQPIYTPCMNADSKALLRKFEIAGNMDIADHLIESLDTTPSLLSGRNLRRSMTSLIPSRSAETWSAGCVLPNNLQAKTTHWSRPVRLQAIYSG